MKLRLLTTAILFLGLTASAQLFVSPNSFMFVNDQYVTVTGTVELDAATSNIYLRNEGQLLQKTAGASTNSGLGDLSLYQEGTVNNFQYNYWCSPVGNTLTDTATNNPFGISQLKRVAGLATFTNPDLSNATMLDGTDTPYALAQRWIYKFVTSNAYSQWAYVGNTNTLDAGQGFTMKGTDVGNQRYDFRGKPNDGIITQNVSAANFTLVGNPYPSAIDLNMVLLGDNPGPDLAWGTGDDPAPNNPAIDGTAYFWEQVAVNTHLIAGYQGGYGKYTPLGGYLRADIWSYNADGSQNVDLNPDGGAIDQDGTAFARRFSPIGQGFMVMGNGVAPNTVSMQNKFRTFVKEGGTSQFARAASASATQLTNEFYPAIPNVAGTDYTLQSKSFAPQIRIHASVNQNVGFIRTALGFVAGTTNGLDRGGDAQSTSDTAPFSFYHILDGSNKEFSMSISPFDMDRFYPVGFRCNADATFKLKAVKFLNFTQSENVYLFDSQTGLYHDIKNSEYQVTLPSGVHNTRFKITFRQAPLSVKEDISALFNVFQNNEKSLLIINNPNTIALKSVEVYDISGKVMMSKSGLGSDSTYELNTATLAQGVYIVKLITGTNQEMVKKVSVSNKK